MAHLLRPFVFALIGLLVAPAIAEADSIEDARGMVEEGKRTLAKAKKTRSKRKRPKLYADGLKKYARAYLLLVGRGLDNDAPELLKEIGQVIADTNGSPEIVRLRSELLKSALDATIEGRLTDAYDALAGLRDLDPRDPTVDYALTVIGQKMEGE